MRREVRRAFALCFCLCVLIGAPAAAEIYRCTDAGGTRFVDDPSSCDQPVKYEPEGVVQTTRESPAAKPAPASDTTLDALLPGPVQVGPDWEITREALVTQVDRDQQGWGVIETLARHYGRVRSGVTEVCTIELWRMASDAQAEAAARGMRYPGWSFAARGTLLVTLRGTRWQRGQAFQKGLFPDCLELGDQIRTP